MASSREKIEAELENLDTVVLDIVPLSLQHTLSKHEVNSAALLVHNFYNGIENVLKQCCLEHKLAVPQGNNWHKDLLDLTKKEKFVSAGLYDVLLMYLKFRHFISHSYTFSIKLERFSPLLKDTEKTYQKFKKEIKKLL